MVTHAPVTLAKQCPMSVPAACRSGPMHEEDTQDEWTAACVSRIMRRSTSTVPREDAERGIRPLASRVMAVSRLG